MKKQIFFITLFTIVPTLVFAGPRYDNINKKSTASHANTKQIAKNKGKVDVYLQSASDDSYDPETGNPRITTITTTTKTTKVIRPLKVENIGSAKDREKERLRKLELKKIYSHTAEGFKQLQINTLGTTLVIDREEIDRLRPNNVAELIANRSGIEIASRGFYYDDTEVRIQGSSPKQVLVLVNNVPISSALDAKNYLEDIPIEIVERVEITKNSQSVTYGSGANGGVINIFTGKKQGYGDIELSYGDYNTGKLSGRARGSLNDDQTVISVNGGVTLSEGASGVNSNDKSEDKAPLQNLHFDIVFNQKLNEDANFNLAFNYNRLNKDIKEVPINVYKRNGVLKLFDQVFTDPAKKTKASSEVLSIAEDRSQYGLNLDIGGNIANGWGMKFLASTNLNMSTYTLPSLQYATMKSYAKLESYFSNDFSRLSMGLDYNRSDLFEYKTNSLSLVNNQTFNYSEKFVHNLGMYLQSRFDIFQYVSLFLGARYDLVPEELIAYIAGDEATKKVAKKKIGGASANFGVVGHINENNSLGLSAALGHRLPTMLEKYNLDNANADLAAEMNLSAELFWRYANLDGWYAGTIVFYRMDMNRIYLDTASNSYKDDLKADNVGLDVYFGKKFDNIRFQTNLTGQYQLNGVRDRMAMFYTRFDFDYVGDNWSLGTGVNLALKRQDEGNELPLYALMNFKATWDFIQNWQLFAKLDLSLTKEYRTMYGYNNPGHGFGVGIKANF